MTRLRTMRILGVCLSMVWCSAGKTSAQPAPPEKSRQIQEQLARLNEAISELPRTGPAATWLPDVEICAKAAEWILRHEEFYKPRYADDTLAVLDLGLERVAQLKATPQADRAPWLTAPGSVALGYRSKVDGSVQPYALTFPVDFEPGSQELRPLVVKLHGRQSTLTEVDFIRRSQAKAEPDLRDSFQLDVFGRTNNAYRWSGETDVFEAIEDVCKRFPIDGRRVTLWGFSMGGAGAWHLGLHHPSRWSSVGAGAGFVDFYAYQNRQDPLPEFQHRALHIYDAADYAVNAFNVPFITYGGEQDKQLAAGLTMKLAALKQDVPMRLLVGAGMGHKFDNDSLAQFMAFHSKHSVRGRLEEPGRPKLRFVTYTLKYNRCEWLTILEMQELYAPATAESRVDDKGILHLKTENIGAFRASRDITDQLTIDEQGPCDLADVEGAPREVTFVNEAGKWRLLTEREARLFDENPELHKRHNLQGPIDDAFMEPFICVRGTATPWSRAQHEWAMWTLDRFEREYDKWMRAQVPVIDDRDVNDELIARHHLVLFGDPGSNAVLSRIIDRLPVQWTRDAFVVQGRSYDCQTHGLALIFPNPLNPQRYVVINSGHTMHERDFQSSNAWLFPKLGDIAVLKYEAQAEGGYSEDVIWADLFDTKWKLADDMPGVSKHP